MMSKKQRQHEAEASMRLFLHKIGYKGTHRIESVNEIPNYKMTSSLPRLSDSICCHGPKKDENKYTGHELQGIGTMHKSNSVPIRKDNKDAAIEITQMRRN